MNVQLLQTGDGSHTLYTPQFDEMYHSRHGALTESQHIFISNGLEAIDSTGINVFEVGFGTGLNALLSWLYAENKDIQINYHSIELYPIPQEIISQINYPELIGSKEKFQKLHHAEWDKTIQLSSHFSLHKINASIIDFQPALPSMHIVFFDAFSPEKQPEMWTTEIFDKMFKLLASNRILVTYCSKSYVRKNMQQAGFEIKKLQGPHGKRDMVRAKKP
jgi:tRNA U34 5-methylaminomethyl-2-thiouridine-forming methyltransferase MnmC